LQWKLFNRKSLRVICGQRKTRQNRIATFEFGAFIIFYIQYKMTDCFVNILCSSSCCPQAFLFFFRWTKVGLCRRENWRTVTKVWWLTFLKSRWYLSSYISSYLLKKYREKSTYCCVVASNNFFHFRANSHAKLGKKLSKNHGPIVTNTTLNVLRLFGK
jgi:hypothetical protein